MAETRTPLSDGGYLISYIEDVPDTAYDKLHVQKHAGDGTPVGAEFVTDEQANLGPGAIQGLSNGGFVVVSGWALRGYYYTASVFDPAAVKLADIDAPGAGEGFQIAASGAGGFLIQSRDIAAAPGGVNYYGRPLLTLYDNAGAAVSPTTQLTGSDIAVATTPDGAYAVSWTDGNLQHAFVLDPASPPDLSAPPAPAILGIFDDSTGRLRPAMNGAVDDLTPVVRIAVDRPGFVQLSYVADRGYEDPRVLGGTAISPEDLARGYIDLPVSAFPWAGSVYAHYKSAYGVPGPATAQALMITGEPPIQSATDDFGASAGLIASGATTDDATPTLHVGLAQTVAQVGGTLTVQDAGTAVAQATLTSADISRGYIELTTTALTPGEHHLGTRLGDGAPSVFTFDLTIQPNSSGAGAGQTLTSPGPGSMLSGGDAADTLIASAGLDTLTGGGGADVFAFSTEPWAPIHVTDFVLGADKLDLSRLFQASGYTGSDPVADGFLYLESDGAGGTLLRFDRDGGGPNQQWPNTFLDLEHVSPAGLTWAQLQANGSSAPPPADGGHSGGGEPGPGAGRALVSPAPGASLSGGAGADTFTASDGLDTLTGGGGADVFGFGREPWAPIHITDFTPGEDKLDLSGLLRTAGYAGSDPLADGYIYIESDGAGGSVLRFDHDGAGPNPEWPNTILDLEHVAPGQVSASDWILA